MSHNILIDSGFWFALYEPRDQYHSKAEEIFFVIEEFKKIIPWPTLYEIINTRFIKRKHYISFDKIIKQSKTIKISDVQYRQSALSSINSTSKYLSLVDAIIRSMLEDSNLKIDALVTFNAIDFSDICYSRSIEILNA